jgi:hypothetical protein
MKLNNTLNYGSSGYRVASFQRFLLTNHFDLGYWGADGVLGNATTAAIERFQDKVGLPVTGVIDHDTWQYAEDYSFGPINDQGKDFIKPRHKAEQFPVHEDGCIADVVELIGNVGYDLIIKYEVGGGRSYYEKRLMSPTVPGAWSGVTIGIGWDLRFNDTKAFDKAWGELLEFGVLSHEQFFRLRNYVGREISSSRRDSVERELQDIKIPWYYAHKVFCTLTIPRFYALAANTFPGFLSAPIEIRAALTSLVFNRGASLRGNRRKFMRAIYQELKSGSWKRVGHNLRKMEVWWRGMSVYLGLKRRRYEEADVADSAQSK